MHSDLKQVGDCLPWHPNIAIPVSMRISKFAFVDMGMPPKCALKLARGQDLRILQSDIELPAVNVRAGGSSKRHTPFQNEAHTV